jgi:hypothetical protein
MLEEMRVYASIASAPSSPGQDAVVTPPGVGAEAKVRVLYAPTAAIIGLMPTIYS